MKPVRRCARCYGSRWRRYAADLGAQNIAPLYGVIGVIEAVLITLGYLSAISWGVLPVLGYFALRYLCEGMSWTAPAMVISGVGLLLKIPLNYWFIYGGWGLPPWAVSAVVGRLLWLWGFNS